MMWKLAPLGTVLAGLTLWSAVQAGDKGLEVKGQIKLGEHHYKMVAGALYRLEAEGKKFRPGLFVGRTPEMSIFQHSFDKKNTYTAYAIVSKTQDYRIVVTPDPLDPIGTGVLDYTLKITPVVLEAKPVLQVADKFTDKDPLYQPQRNAHFKAYPLKAKAGRFYLIDLVKKSDIDPYLYLENDGREIVARDDDSGGDLNARIVFLAEKDGDYRIIATTLSKAEGAFELTVRGEKK